MLEPDALRFSRAATLPFYTGPKEAVEQVQGGRRYGIVRRGLRQIGMTQLSVARAQNVAPTAMAILKTAAGSDNFANIPTRYAPAPDAMTLATGDAGPRIACGIMQAADSSADATPAR